ncbi:MAG TPA: ComEC/Rec2 family competence protein [Candidatus Paceibacterota bacterium]
MAKLFSAILFGFIIGILLASFINFSDSFPLYLILISISLLAVVGYRGFLSQNQTTRSMRGHLLVLIFVLIVMAFGIIRYQAFDKEHGVLTSFRDIKVGGKGLEITMRGYVVGEGSASEKAARVPVLVKEIAVSGRSIFLDENLLVITGNYPRYQYGSFVEITGHVESPKNFDTFDYISYLKKDGIRTIAPFPEIREIDSLRLGYFEKTKIGIFRGIFRIKNTFSRAIQHSVPEPNASYLNGILLGVRQDIPPSLKEAFSRTSTSHILAISGYNITILFELVTAFLVFFMIRRKAFWASVILLVIFTILTGASASVVRAAIMGFLGYFARSYGRVYDPKNSLLLAAAIMAAFNPMVLVNDIGFQLSFLAVIGLIYLYPWLEDKFARLPKGGQTKEILLISLSAQIMVAPLILYYFQTFSLVSLLANILVLPFVPLVMALGFITGILGMIWLPLGILIGYFAWALSWYQISVIKILSALPFASISFSIHWLILVVVYTLLIYFLVCIDSESKKEYIS